jgi:SAM-dependent methyltransferase
MNNGNRPTSSASWDTYWQGSKDGAPFGTEGVSHPLVAAYWERIFSLLADASPSTKIIDIASGSGPVIDSIHSVFGPNTPDITSLDVSSAAISRICEKYPNVHGVVADAAEAPFENGTFDIVTSQFGVEYAGPNAVADIGRLVAPGGHLALMLHHRGSSFYQECADGLDAIRRMQESKFVPYAREMFDAGFRAVRGASREDYEAAGKRFAPTIEVVEKILEDHGEHVAGDTVARIYDTVGRIHAEIQHYEPGEVLAWLERMQQELEPFADRLESMNRVALDSEMFHAVCDKLKKDGFSIDEAAELTASSDDPPLAWVLLARREDDATDL